MIAQHRTILTLLTSLTVAWGGHAQLNSDGLPSELEDVDIVEHLDEPLPLDAHFVDEHGNPVTLGDYFTDDRPVIITLNYFRCPMLCTYQLNGLIAGLNDVDFEPGTDFDIVTISFDPREDAELAAQKEKAYTRIYQRDGAEDGWAFLTGDEANIRKVTDAIGFSYKWNEAKNEWAHGAAIFLATPDGRLSRYVYGIEFDSTVLKRALLEAGEGKIGTTTDRFIQWCLHWDDKTGQYTANVMNIMRLAGGLTVLVLGVGVYVLWRRDRASRAAQELNRNAGFAAGTQS